MGEALRKEVVETDIKVTLIEPGMADTPFFGDARPECWRTRASPARRCVR
jgi:NADP-dependent 3-hydroxy acid dehydrogenase YdfG